jgi:hypothetical protein
MVRRSLVAFTVALLCAASRIGADASPEKAGEAAARSWLTLVDAGKYGESWDAAASAFRAALTRSQWESALDQVRKPLGKVVSRSLKVAKYTTEVPNAPAGEYVVLQFDTSFENRPSAVETVTPMKEKDGTWKVSGYFIR